MFFLMPVTGDLIEMHNPLNVCLNALQLTQPKLSCRGLALIRFLVTQWGGLACLWTMWMCGCNVSDLPLKPLARRALLLEGSEGPVWRPSTRVVGPGVRSMLEGCVLKEVYRPTEPFRRRLCLSRCGACFQFCHLWENALLKRPSSGSWWAW